MTAHDRLHKVPRHRHAWDEAKVFISFERPKQTHEEEWQVCRTCLRMRDDR